MYIFNINFNYLALYFISHMHCTIAEVSSTFDPNRTKASYLIQKEPRNVCEKRHTTQRDMRQPNTHKVKQPGLSSSAVWCQIWKEHSNYVTKQIMPRLNGSNIKQWINNNRTSALDQTATEVTPSVFFILLKISLLNFVTLLIKRKYACI